MYNVYAHHILCVFLCAFVCLYTHIHTRILLHVYNQGLMPVHSKDTFIMQSREKKIRLLIENVINLREWK